MAQQVLSHVSHVGVEHNDWLRGISFYLDEIKILENRLGELSLKSTKLDDKKGIEHFQNLFIVHRGNLENLEMAITTNLKHISQDVEVKANHLSNSTMAEHDVMRDRYIYLEKTLQDIRHEFAKFFVSVVG